jgi:hypothetical protein
LLSTKLNFSRSSLLLAFPLVLFSLFSLLPSHRGPPHRTACHEYMCYTRARAHTHTHTHKNKRAKRERERWQVARFARGQRSNKPFPRCSLQIFSAPQENDPSSFYATISLPLFMPSLLSSSLSRCRNFSGKRSQRPLPVLKI